VHLRITYSLINPTQLADNYNKMTASTSFQDPIETLFKQIEDGVRYANAGMQPYMEAHYVNIAFLLVINTGVVPDDCTDWQWHTWVNQTWAQFRTEFARAQCEHRIISIMASGSSYHTANVADHYVHGQLPPPIHASDGDVAIAMANLDSAAAADRDTVAAPTKMIAALLEQLAARNMFVKT
jgi:hypothetical protein